MNITAYPAYINITAIYLQISRIACWQIKKSEDHLSPDEKKKKIMHVQNMLFDIQSFVLCL